MFVNLGHFQTRLVPFHIISKCISSCYNRLYAFILRVDLDRFFGILRAPRNDRHSFDTWIQDEAVCNRRKPAGRGKPRLSFRELGKSRPKFRFLIAYRVHAGVSFTVVYAGSSITVKHHETPKYETRTERNARREKNALITAYKCPFDTNDDQ